MIKTLEQDWNDCAEQIIQNRIAEAKERLGNRFTSKKEADIRSGFWFEVRGEFSKLKGV